MPSDISPPKANPMPEMGTLIPGWANPFGVFDIPVPDITGWLPGDLFGTPGPVVGQKGLKKGQPVPPPGNPPEKGGSANPGILNEAGKSVAQQFADAFKDVIDTFIPTAGQKRDIAVYGLALIVFVVALIAILK